MSDIDKKFPNATPRPWHVDEFGIYCGHYCSPSGCPENHPSGEAELIGPSYEWEGGSSVADQSGPRTFKLDDANAIVHAVATYDARDEALREAARVLLQFGQNPKRHRITLATVATIKAALAVKP